MDLIILAAILYLMIRSRAETRGGSFGQNDPPPKGSRPPRRGQIDNKKELR